MTAEKLLEKFQKFKYSYLNDHEDGWMYRRTRFDSFRCFLSLELRSTALPPLPFLPLSFHKKSSKSIDYSLFLPIPPPSSGINAKEFQDCGTRYRRTYPHSLFYNTLFDLLYIFT